MANVTLGGDCVAVVAVDTAAGMGGGAHTAEEGSSRGSTTTSPIRFTGTGACIGVGGLS